MAVLLPATLNATWSRLILKKQLLQVIGGKRNLFLTVGAKTCFGGWAPKKLRLHWLVAGKSRGGQLACAGTLFAQTCQRWIAQFSGGESDADLDHRGEDTRQFVAQRQ